MKTRRLLQLLLLLATVPLACSGSDSYSTANFGPAEILWKLQAFQLRDDTAIEIPEPGRYTLFFHRTGAVDITADCTACTGEYALGGGLFRMAVNECTTASCPPPSFDQRYIAALIAVTAFRMEGNVLTLTYVGGTMTFRS